MSSALTHEPTQPRGRRLARSLGLLAVLLFLLAGAAARAQVLAGDAASSALVAVALLAPAASLLGPAWLGLGLELFGASLFLYGFHSYRPQSLAFELALSALAVVLVIRLARGRRLEPAAGLKLVLPLFALFAALASVSLLLLPPRVLEHRAFLEGPDFARAVLTAFPKDPLYPIASVGRLWLFLVFAAALASQAEAGVLAKRLLRGVAWAVAMAALFGILDFLGLVPLARYNLSHLFFSAEYRRLQSTFGNPSWFACFVACGLPFLLMAFAQAGPKLRVVLAAVFPMSSAALFLSGARASWIAAAVWLVGLMGLALATRRRLAQPLPAWGPLGWTALAASLATFAVLATGAYAPSRSPGSRAVAPLGRLEGLSREIQIRGVGFSSPRGVAAAYALELAKERPVLGLGYESFNIHLRAQLERPGSGVARVVNSAVVADPSETLFDDSHNSYLQVLTGTGALGLLLWLCACGSALLVTLLVLARAPGPENLAVLLGMLVFCVYGLFQGMAYIPVIFFLLFAEAGYVMSLDPGPLPAWLLRARPWALGALAALVLVALPAQLADRGYASLKRTFGITAYLPEEAAEFEGFYRPESGAQGEFRWMGARGIVNVRKAAPFRLSFTCGHPDLDREPAVLSLRYEGGDLGTIVCRRPGTQEKRFEPRAPGSLRLVVSRTFQPGADDRRELGVAVSPIRWE